MTRKKGQRRRRWKKDDGSTDRSDGVVDCFGGGGKRGSDGLGWVCMYGRGKSSEAACSRRGFQVLDGMFGGERQTARTGTGASEKNELGRVRAPLLFCVRPASSQLRFPGSQHQFPISFQISQGPSGPPFFSVNEFCLGGQLFDLLLLTYCTVERAYQILFLRPLGSKQNHPSLNRQDI